MGGTGSWQPRDIRTSNAEREQAVELLQQAVGEGRLDVTEFESRVTRVLASKTRSELDEVFADLPAGLPAREPEQTVVELKNQGGTVLRRGAWKVPTTLRLLGSAGTVQLDFTEAELPGPVVVVELDISRKTVDIVVPTEIQVDTDDLDAHYTRITDQSTLTGDPAHRIRIVLRGRAKHCRLRIANPGQSPAWMAVARTIRDWTASRRERS